MIRTRRPLLALCALLAALGIGYGVKAVDGGSGAHSSPTPSPVSSAHARPVVALSTLSVQVRQTVQLIERHGPFPYSEDGAVFDNIGDPLPVEKRGYYHEYTVPTPESDDRGERRLITGMAGEYFYTADHYASFVRVDIAR